MPTQKIGCTNPTQLQIIFFKMFWSHSAKNSGKNCSLLSMPTLVGPDKYGGNAVPLT